MRMKVFLVASILLMLSLEATLLVAGRPSVAEDAGSTILLPSQGKGVAAAMAERRPWTCCDKLKCRSSYKLFCDCADEVEECAPDCDKCVRSKWNTSLKVCKDMYIGNDPGPECTDHKDRPWECCNNLLCNTSNPPTCTCVDEVDQCPATCKACVPSFSYPPRFICDDSYRGLPGPKCIWNGVAGGGN